ncbi:tyrosine-protein phosphatase [Thalassobacillus pellis]|uniref:tyrosine-protein phosphatase n=1 Tax=Thalassobacillus pellis TaxID=748008 RepID=UPI00195FB53B|nr:CpsB/CapC family capsule biosynthesis tyrosine phosphatase [Thalassobacillus pellis]MBM7551674.1 protein-tyrosine phosphatase [Thalassobacillus pellis]
MIDIHCHILPGVDDGAQTLEESLAMVREAIDQGIDTIVATPHHFDGRYENHKLDVLQQVQELNYEIQRAGLDMTIMPGQEIRLYGEMAEELKRDELLPINVESGYVFVEMPSDQVPTYAKQLLLDILRTGYKPIIVHPERNKKFMQEPGILYELVKNGAYTQVTAGSVAGKFGKSVQKFTHQLIEHNLTHLIASDAHNVKNRGFFMKDAFREIKKRYGASSVYHFAENSFYVTDGQVVAADPPERIKAKKFMGIF